MHSVLTRGCCLLLIPVNCALATIEQESVGPFIFRSEWSASHGSQRSVAQKLAAWPANSNPSFETRGVCNNAAGRGGEQDAKGMRTRLCRNLNVEGRRPPPNPERWPARAKGVGLLLQIFDEH